MSMDNRGFEKNGYQYEIKWIEDNDADLSYLEQDYTCKPDCDCEHKHCTPAMNVAQQAQDQARLKEYGDQWCMMGCEVTIRKQTATRWANAPIVGKAGLYGIESDSSPEYVKEVEQELIAAAEADMVNLKAALCA